jgi:ribosome-associated toxin RatA of RatAB toxin-antitoxin module
LAPLTLFPQSREQDLLETDAREGDAESDADQGPSLEGLRDPSRLFATASCSLDTIQQEMERLEQGARRLAVQLRLTLEPDWLWAVLTDYANLSRFIPNLASSRLLWRRGNRVGLEQVGTQQFCGLRFSARVELELEEHREAGELRFQMRSGDFRRFDGVWRIDTDPSSTRLLYALVVQGKPGMPIGLIEQRLQQDLANNLRGVQQEAMRRASQLAG